MVKLVLIFFISLLSFSVGTYVGKQVSDNDHRRAQIEGDYGTVASHGEAGHDSHSDSQKSEEEKLSDDEIASLTEEFVTKEKDEAKLAAPVVERAVASQAEETSGYKKYNGGKETKAEAAPVQKSAPANRATASDLAHAPATAAAAKWDAKAHSAPAANLPAPAATKVDGAPPAKLQAAPKADPAAKAADRVAGGMAPAADQKEARKPDTVLPSVAATAVGKYTVQVASYPDEAGAKTHAADLKGKGWNAFYVPAEIQGKTWYRVSVGLFTSAKSAGEFRKEFQKESNVASAIVQKIIQ